MFRKLTVREAEIIARKIAVEKVRKKEYAFDPEVAEIEEKLAKSLGTRVHIERKEVGGKVTIDFFSKDDLRSILDFLNKEKGLSPKEEIKEQAEAITQATPVETVDDRSPVEKKEEENEDIYSVNNFTI